jgi:hypothetical protein
MPADPAQKEMTEEEREYLDLTLEAGVSKGGYTRDFTDKLLVLSKIALDSTRTALARAEGERDEVRGALGLLAGGVGLSLPEEARRIRSRALAAEAISERRRVALERIEELAVSHNRAEFKRTGMVDDRFVRIVEEARSALTAEGQGEVV